MLREEWQLELPLKAEVEKSDSITDETSSTRSWPAADALFDGQAASGGRRAVHALHAHGAAAVDRQPLARAPGGAGLPAPGHPPARLCAEEPEAGIQARGLRAVLAAARRGEDGSHARADDGAHPDAGAGGAGGRGDRGAGQRRSATSPTRTRTRTAACRRRPTPATAGRGRCRKVGRNEPCPCGSGKKYKHCHGKLA